MIEAILAFKGLVSESDRYDLACEMSKIYQEGMDTQTMSWWHREGRDMYLRACEIDPEIIE